MASQGKRISSPIQLWWRTPGRVSCKFRVLLDPSKLQESHSWGLCLLPEPEHQAHGSASAYCCVIIFYFRAHELFLRTNMIIFDSLERRNVVKSKFTKSSWLKQGLLLLPVCLKHSFCLLEILHLKRSVMICLSLAGSFVMESGSFFRFASSFIPWKWSVLQLWMVFYLFVVSCTWKALAVSVT